MFLENKWITKKFQGCKCGAGIIKVLETEPEKFKYNYLFPFFHDQKHTNTSLKRVVKNHDLTGN